MKYGGNIGFGFPTEGTGNREGIWDDVIEEHLCYGDILSATQRMLDGNSTVNENVRVSDRISIITDDYVARHLSRMRYVEYIGARWEISSIENKPPRVILTIGGLYNGPTPRLSPST